MNKRRRKICFIVQRYGLEVNGGAELLCRQLAEHAQSDDLEVHVLTSQAVDYITWRNEYITGYELINGVHVHRFPVVHERNRKEFDDINGRFLLGECFNEDQEREWLEKQGPALPGLIEYLKANKNEFDAFIFSTYLYYQTVLGIPVVADKAICMPNAHDEPFLRMSIFDNVFLLPRAFLFNTDEERQLVQSRYQNRYIPNEIGGAGVDVPKDIDPVRFKEKYEIDDFIIYVGRIDESKNCGELFKYFQKYKERNCCKMKLVLMGKATMEIPKDRDILSLGFVSDQDKFDGIAAAKVLVLPSCYESLSMVVLESMSVRTNVLVNGQCPVLRSHCIKSNGALYYRGYFEFEGMLNYFFKQPEIANQMKENALRYVQENYRWDVIVGKLRKLLGLVF